MQIRKMDLLRPAQVALMLGVSTKQVQRYANQGKLRCVKLPSGHRRFRGRDVIGFMQQMNNNRTEDS